MKQENDFYLVDEAADSNLSDTASMDDVVPEIWSRQVLRVFEDNLVVSQFARRMDLQEGDQMHIPKFNDDTITVDDHTEGADVTVSQLTDTVVTVTPGIKAARIQISDEVKNRALQGLDLINYAAEELGRTLAEKVEDMVIGELEAEYSSGTYSGQEIDNSGSAITATLIKQAFSEAQKIFVSSNVPGPYACVMRPDEYQLLLDDSSFTDASQFGGREAVLNGRISQYKGFDIVLSNRLRSSGDWDGDTNDDFDMWFMHAGAGTSSAVVLGTLAQPRIENFRQEWLGNDLVASIDVGVQLQRSKSAIRHVFQAAA